MVDSVAELSKLISGMLLTEEEHGYTDEDQLLNAILFRVNELIDVDPGLLFSYLYRLDVSEQKIRKVMNTKTEEDTGLAIARLILERQKLRLYTKKTIKQKPIDGWEW